ncbi:MAG TPA: MCE family protein [Acidimicrobiales bacterium]|nr:MCE family protein [Acidimicrobiales bacterium]
MITRRLLINLIAFFVVSFALVGYGVVNLLGNPLSSPTVLTTHFPNASGLYAGFEVELNGVPVGTVSSTALTKTATKVTMSINPGISVPSNVQASVQIANDLGEQVVNLVPQTHTDPHTLTSGSNVPAQPNEVPADVGQVVATATKLLQAIPANDLNKLIGELATSLQGNAGNLRTLIDAGTTFSKEFVAYQQQFTELLANSPPALDAVTAVAPELRQDLANTAALVQVLAQQGQTGLHNLLANGSSAFTQINNLITSQSANLGCFLHDTADILTNLAQPANLTNLSQGLAYNQFFFGAVDKIAVAGKAVSPTKNSPPDQNQVFLRTRLLLPPILSEQGVSYASANQIPDTLPGAGCTTVFGQGVGPATQAGFTPAAGGHLVKPSAQESNVELNAGPQVPVSNASYRVPRTSEGLLLALGALVVPALLLAWGARPSRRRTRRRA